MYSTAMAIPVEPIIESGTFDLVQDARALALTLGIVAARAKDKPAESAPPEMLALQQMHVEALDQEFALRIAVVKLRAEMAQLRAESDRLKAAAPKLATSK